MNIEMNLNGRIIGGLQYSLNEHRNINALNFFYSSISIY